MVLLKEVLLLKKDGFAWRSIAEQRRFAERSRVFLKEAWSCWKNIWWMDGQRMTDTHARVSIPDWAWQAVGWGTISHQCTVGLHQYFYSTNSSTVVMSTKYQVVDRHIVWACFGYIVGSTDTRNYVQTLEKQKSKSQCSRCEYPSNNSLSNLSLCHCWGHNDGNCSIL
jgi:hypothetical protein